MRCNIPSGLMHLMPTSQEIASVEVDESHTFDSASAGLCKGGGSEKLLSLLQRETSGDVATLASSPQSGNVDQEHPSSLGGGSVSCELYPQQECTEDGLQLGADSTVDFLRAGLSPLAAGEERGREAGVGEEAEEGDEKRKVGKMGGVGQEPAEQDRLRGQKRSAGEVVRGGVAGIGQEYVKEEVTDVPDSSGEFELGETASGGGGRNSKKPRLVWTAELHSRFMNAVNHLGVKNAVPKTILQLMNVEGMTRENVASHLQKYRLYLKRLAGLPPSARLPSDMMMGGGPQMLYGGHPQMDMGHGMMMPPQGMPMHGPPLHQTGHPMGSHFSGSPHSHGLPRPDMGAVLATHGSHTTAVGMPLGGRMDPMAGYPGPSDHMGGGGGGGGGGGSYRLSPVSPSQYSQQMYGCPPSLQGASLHHPWEAAQMPGVAAGLGNMGGGGVPVQNQNVGGPYHSRMPPGNAGLGAPTTYLMPSDGSCGIGPMSTMGSPVPAGRLHSEGGMAMLGQQQGGQIDFMSVGGGWAGDGMGGEEAAMAAWSDDRGRHRWMDGGAGSGSRPW